MYDTAGGELAAAKSGGKGAGVRRGGGGGGNSDCDSDCDSSDEDSCGGDGPRARQAVELLLSRIAEATGRVAALKGQVADAIKRTTLGR